MTELNPYRRVARVLAFGCYLLAGVFFVAGIFFTLAAATMDLSQLPIPNITNQRMAFMIVSMFTILVLMTVLIGVRVQQIYGQEYRQEKLAAKAAVAGLRLGSLGCALWAVPSTVGVLISGKLLATGEPAGWREIFVGASGFVLATIVMLSVAWMIHANFVRLTAKERQHAYEAYTAAIQPLQHRLAESEVREFVQAQTMEVLAKLDGPLKYNLLGFLSEHRFLTGSTRIGLQGADFRSVDLRRISLPEADLHGINLEQASLQGAVLHKVNLINANLKKADLTEAHLQGASLRKADLKEAVLERVNLRDADLTGAKVINEQLKTARMGNTIKPDGTVAD